MAPRDTPPAGRPKAPLYQRIETQLREAIAEGRYPVGSLLPTEAELCERLRVSRHTVREALRRLKDAGLVERRQGAGTLVIAREPDRVFVQTVRDISGLFQFAADTVLVLDSVQPSPLSEEEAAACGARTGERWLRCQGVRRTREGRPIGPVTALVAPRFAAVSALLPETLTAPIYSYIEKRFGVPVAEVVQEISAGLLPAAVAPLFGKKGRPVGMRFVRRYLDAAGEVMLVSFNWHLAERFTYVTRLRRGEA
jgi:DNA-binding GntR family transcriptional regulator